MSLFLGPIHHWLFGKIKLQDQLVEEILGFMKQQEETDESLIGGGASSFLQGLETELAMYGNLPVDNLEDAIDVGNIHGWLQSQISIVEYKLATVITRFVQYDGHFLEDLKVVFFEFGKRSTTLSNRSSPKECYKFLQDILLDGMPCDHANALIESHENYVIWERQVCVHEEFYNEIGGNVCEYYLLRDELIKGIVYNTGVSYEVVDNGIYRLFQR